MRYSGAVLARPGWRFVGVLALVGASGLSCYRSPSGHCEVRCDEDSGCPGGLSCDPAQGRCVAQGQPACSEVLADGPITPLPSFAAVDVGAGFACALDDAGGLWCWGDNRRGQLGLGAPGSRARPTRVGADAGWTAVSVGGAHACGVRAGQLACWGDNGDGQLGVGDLAGRDAPAAVALTGVRAVAAGERHTCAIATDGVHCWGDGAEGKLGLGDADDRDTPGLALVGAAFVGVAAGPHHSCVHDGAQAHCWGRGNSGQLGDGARAARTSPVRVDALPAGITALAAGFSSTCAVASGGLWCWGQGGGGQLGPDAGSGDVAVATVGATTTTWTAVAAGGHVGCGLDAGQVRCWGNPTGGGIPDGRWNQLGHASAPLGPASAIDLGYLDRGAGNNDSNWMNLELGCWLSSGGLTCWGDDSQGGLGQGRAALAESPRRVPGLVAAPSGLVVGGGQVCVGADGGVRCWGSDRWGELTGTERGGSATACRPGACDGTTPAAPTGVDGAVAALAGDRHTCARTAAGALWCWGNNDVGQLGAGAGTLPRQITGDWLELGGGGDYTCGRQAGGWECWGGLGGAAPRVVISPAMTVVRARGPTACGLAEGTGRIWCWGDNNQRQFGDNGAGGTSPRDTGRVASVLAVGHEFACAVVAGGQVECWGRTDRGQAGVIDGSPQAPAPIRVGGNPLTGCTDVGAGVDHACAACGEQVVCWGDNRAGQLGRPADPAPGSPAVVDQPALPWAQVRAGDDVTCAVTSAGAVWCWGQGNHGQLGDGSHASNLPLVVP